MQDFAEVCKRTAAAVGAAAMMMSPFVGILLIYILIVSTFLVLCPLKTSTQLCCLPPSWNLCSCMDITSIYQGHCRTSGVPSTKFWTFLKYLLIFKTNICPCKIKIKSKKQQHQLFPKIEKLLFWVAPMVNWSQYVHCSGFPSCIFWDIGSSVSVYASLAVSALHDQGKHVSQSNIDESVSGVSNVSWMLCGVGPAMARPSDFIQSKPGMGSGDATNEDKFPFNPSVSGNKVIFSLPLPENWRQRKTCDHNHHQS